MHTTAHASTASRSSSVSFKEEARAAVERMAPSPTRVRYDGQ